MKFWNKINKLSGKPRFLFCPFKYPRMNSNKWNRLISRLSKFIHLRTGVRNTKQLDLLLRTVSNITESGKTSCFYFLWHMFKIIKLGRSEFISEKLFSSPPVYFYSGIIYVNQSCPWITFLDVDPTRPYPRLLTKRLTRPDATRGPILPPYV